MGAAGKSACGPWRGDWEPPAVLCGAREWTGEAREEDRQVRGGEGTELRQEESAQFSVVHRLGLKSSEGAIERLMRAVGLSTGGCGWLSWPGWRPGDLRMGSAGPWGWKQQLAWRGPRSGFSGNSPGPEGNGLRGACLFRAVHPGVFPGSPSASDFPDRCLLMRGPTRAHHLGAPGHLKIAQGQERHRGGSVSLRNPAGGDSLPQSRAWSACGSTCCAGGAGGLRDLCPSASQSCWTKLLLKVPEPSPKYTVLVVYIHLNWIACPFVM